jgi:hypothetical protein
MKKIGRPLLLLLALIFLQGCSHYTELEVNGPSNEKLDIILVPSHFYGQDAGSNQQWITDAEAIKNRLLGHPFWKNYRSKINVYRLDVSTADDFKEYNAGSWLPDDETLKTFALKNFPSLDYAQNDQIIFAIESVAYEKDPIYSAGHTRGDPHVVKLETKHLDNVVHEFGHAFGLLSDEYSVKVNIPDWKSTDPNIATLQPGDTCKDRWGDLENVVIEAPGTWIESEVSRIYRIVGCYDATGKGFETKVFRPTSEACIMNQIDEKFPFCPVCQRQLVKLLGKYTPSDDALYDQALTFQIPAEFQKAAINVSVINFDQTGVLDAKTGQPVSSQPIANIDAPGNGVPAGRIYAEAGVSFTSGMISNEPSLNAASPPNSLRATATNPKEHALVAGYFFSKRICSIGVYNTGLTNVTLRTYNAAFLETAKASFVANADTKTFIGIRATGPIYRFEIDAPSATGFGVDDLSFGECPK